MSHSQISAYVAALAGGPQVDTTTFVGRIIRGKKPADFASMSDDPKRRVVMMMAGDGLDLLQQPGLSGYDMLIAIGYAPDYIQEKVAAGTQFKLVVAGAGSSPAVLATWDGVMEAITKAYPRDIASMVRTQLPELKKLRTPGTPGWSAGDWTDLERQAGFKFADVDKEGSGNRNYMTEDRLRASRGSLVDVRAFLYFSCYLKELFSGNGYTYNSAGQRQMKEFICPNVPLTDLGEHEVVDLSVVFERQDSMQRSRVKGELPLPVTFTPFNADKVYQVPYQVLAQEAETWRRKHGIGLAANDRIKIAVMPIDEQITFCLPTGELYVSGRSGTGAVDDTKRLCAWIYRNLRYITMFFPTLDTHAVYQIFHPAFLVDEQGNHPGPVTMVTVDDVLNGKWKVSSQAAAALGKSQPALQAYLIYYVQELARQGKFNLTIWPYHGMLGGIGHALTPEFEKAIQFHAMVRGYSISFQIKGGHPWTENYSIGKPEVTTDQHGNTIAQRNVQLLKALQTFDAVVITGQAKSHCVAWTIEDVLGWILAEDPAMARRIYLLDDCTSPVVVPGIVDYTDQADAAFRRFAAAGMHIVRSTDPIESWPGLKF